MVQRYIFFNSAVGDPRTYQASDFADYFGSVLSTGLLHTDNVPGMSVSVETGTLNTVVSAGKAIMKGHFYDNTADLTLTHAIPEASLDRIDRVVLRLDLRNSERNILLKVLTGVATSTPIAPVLQRDNFIHEISLAQILVRANTVQLLQSDLVDERLDENLGGLVYSLISIPTSQFQAEWDAFMAGIQDSGFATTQSVTDLQTEVTTHKADDAAHEIGDKTLLNTTAKTTIVDAINEVFQTGNNVKSDMVAALLAVDPTLPITTSSTWEEIETATGGISVGKKWAEGNLTNDTLTYVFTTQNGGTTTKNYVDIPKSALGFTPKTITVHRTDLSTQQMSTWKNFNYFNFNASNYSNALMGEGSTFVRTPYSLFVDKIRIPVPVGNVSYTWEANE